MSMLLSLIACKKKMVSCRLFGFDVLCFDASAGGKGLKNSSA